MVFRSPDESGPRNFFRFTPASVFLVFLSFRVFFTTASSSVFRGAAHEREREPRTTHFESRALRPVMVRCQTLRPRRPSRRLHSTQPRTWQARLVAFGT